MKKEKRSKKSRCQILWTQSIWSSLYQDEYFTLYLQEKSTPSPTTSLPSRRFEMLLVRCWLVPRFVQAEGRKTWAWCMLRRSISLPLILFTSSVAPCCQSWLLVIPVNFRDLRTWHPRKDVTTRLTSKIGTVTISRYNVKRSSRILNSSSYLDCHKPHILWLSAMASIAGFKPFLSYMRTDPEATFRPPSQHNPYLRTTHNPGTRLIKQVWHTFESPLNRHHADRPVHIFKSQYTRL